MNCFITRQFNAIFRKIFQGVVREEYTPIKKFYNEAGLYTHLVVASANPLKGDRGPGWAVVINIIHFVLLPTNLK